VRRTRPQPGETILDLCAAPGGKTTFIAQLMNNQGRIVAQDISEERLKLIQENCARLGVTCVETILPSTSNSSTSASFDRILVDAPCSNTGVMRRRVDLRWRIQPEEIERLRAAQLDLLQQAATGGFWFKHALAAFWFTARAAWSRRKTSEVVKKQFFPSSVDTTPGVTRLSSWRAERRVAAVCAWCRWNPAPGQP
jgi:hypothetical protein